MTDIAQPEKAMKKTPTDVTEFAREQLRFFLSGDDLAATLAEMNPSLAWLPILLEMNVIESENQLVAWIERNFADADAIREVVANIRFFGPETAKFLEYRVNAQAATLPPLFVKFWMLIIRQMRASKQGFVGSEWFEIEPQLRRGDNSPAVVQRLANVLCPKLKIGKRLLWTVSENKDPEKPSDLMSIDYEVDDSILVNDVLAAWPAKAMADTDEILLTQLTTVLEGALADAIYVGVEGNEGFSTSDSDVPSVAQHPQNEYRSGFQIIVRVMAEIWTRLVAKSDVKAIAVAERWRDGPFRLTRRLALFSFTNHSVPANFGADMLIGLPAGELFLTSACVEVYRLIRSRWKDFSGQKRQQILARLREGPPYTSFREGADIEQHIDRARFTIFSDMTRDGLDIGPEGKELLAEIQSRQPQWKPLPPEQAGFQIWSESGPILPETDGLKGVADSELLNEARRIAAQAGFMVGDSWQDLCQSEPDRALRGLDAAAKMADWSPAHCERLLRSSNPYADPATESKIAELLLRWPDDSFHKIAAAAAWWLNAHAKTLPDELVWPLWDRVADVTLLKPADADHE